jgi:hypothetical protein
MSSIIQLHAVTGRPQNLWEGGEADGKDRGQHGHDGIQSWDNNEKEAWCWTHLWTLCVSISASTSSTRQVLIATSSSSAANQGGSKRGMQGKGIRRGWGAGEKSEGESRLAPALVCPTLPHLPPLRFPPLHFPLMHFPPLLLQS